MTSGDDIGLLHDIRLFCIFRMAHNIDKFYRGMKIDRFVFQIVRLCNQWENKKPTIRWDRRNASRFIRKLSAFRFAYPRCHDNHHNGGFGKPTNGLLKIVEGYVLLNFEALESQFLKL